MFKYDMGRFIFVQFIFVSKMMHEKNRINVQFGQVSSKFAAVKTAMLALNLLQQITVKLAVNLLQQKPVKLAVNLLQ